MRRVALVLGCIVVVAALGLMMRRGGASSLSSSIVGNAVRLWSRFRLGDDRAALEKVLPPGISLSITEDSAASHGSPEKVTTLRLTCRLRGPVPSGEHEFIFFGGLLEEVRFCPDDPRGFAAEVSKWGAEPVAWQFIDGGVGFERFDDIHGVTCYSLFSVSIRSQMEDFVERHD